MDEGMYAAAKRRVAEAGIFTGPANLAIGADVATGQELRKNSLIDSHVVEQARQNEQLAAAVARLESIVERLIGPRAEKEQSNGDAPSMPGVMGALADTTVVRARLLDRLHSAVRRLAEIA